MVGLRLLVPSIGVRVPVRQQSASPKCVYTWGLCRCSADRDSNGGAGTQDDRREGLSASRVPRLLVKMRRMSKFELRDRQDESLSAISYNT